MPPRMLISVFKVKAIEYLGNMRATDATPALAQQLFLRDVHAGVKKKVLIALGKIGGPAWRHAHYGVSSTRP